MECGFFHHFHTLKQDNQQQEVRRVAIAILNYWRDHPLAKDSVKGIAQYWVGEQSELVYQALVLLIEEGLVEKRRHLYQLKPSQPESTKDIGHNQGPA